MRDNVNLQTNLDQVVKWSRKWLINLNISKCKVTTINRKQDVGVSYNIAANGESFQLERVDNEKDLGFLIDSRLNFENHINKTVKKANKIVGVFKRNFYDLNVKTFVLLYKSMIRSHLEYAQTVWSPYKQKHIEALEAVQRRATKILPCMKKLSYGNV